VNYTSEKLHQFLNAQIFELEQALYRAEKIDWIPFNSNFNKAHVELTEKMVNVIEEESEKVGTINHNNNSESVFDSIFAQLYKNRFFSAHPGQPFFQIEHLFGKVIFIFF
jgi:myosin heavy subunit